MGSGERRSEINRVTERIIACIFEILTFVLICVYLLLTMGFDSYRRLSAANLLRKIFAAAGLTATLLLPVRLEAQIQYGAQQVAMLPPYCKYTLLFRDNVPGGNNPAEIERWTKIMGSTFRNMHHYCWGMMATNRAKFFSHTRQERMRHYFDSIGEFDYVIQRVPPDFPLLPEIFTMKGENLIQLGRGPLGILELQRAIELKPNYWPPYAAMSDYYKEIGDLAKAREWLERGLSVTPDVKALRLRMAEIDGAKDKRKNTPQRPEKPSAPQSPAEKSAAQPDSQPAEPPPPAER